MADEEKEKLQYICKYKVKTLVIMKGEEKIECDHSNILAIEYLSDYEYNLRALLKVTLRMDVRKRMWVLKNKKEISVKFELNKFGMDIDVEEIVTSDEEVWNEEFGMYLNDEDEAIDVKILEERLERNEETVNMEELEIENYYETQNILDIYLFHPKLLKASKYSFNRIYTENTLQNMVAEMLTDSKHVEILMSKFENDEVYKELLLPPNPVYKDLIYLDQWFGYYKKGAIIYYDIDTLYILNANGKVTAKREKEWVETVFLVKMLDKATPGNGMERVEDEEIYYCVLSEMDINPQKITIGKNVELGSDAKIVIKDDIVIDLYEAEQSYIDERNENIRFIKKQNKYTGEVVKARMEENECIVYINAENLDLNAFRPNKTYKIVFDEPIKQQRYGKHKYRLAYAYHYLKLDSEHMMSSSHKIVLKKTEGPVT